MRCRCGYCGSQALEVRCRAAASASQPSTTKIRLLGCYLRRMRTTTTIITYNSNREISIPPLGAGDRSCRLQLYTAVSSACSDATWDGCGEGRLLMLLLLRSASQLSHRHSAEHRSSAALLSSSSTTTASCRPTSAAAAAAAVTSRFTAASKQQLLQLAQIRRRRRRLDGFLWVSASTCINRSINSIDHKIDKRSIRSPIAKLQPSESLFRK